MTLPYLMTEPKAAKQLGISTNTLRAIRSRGEISFRVVGKRIKYTEEDLKRYLGERWEDSSSGTTGCPGDQTASSGAERGSIVRLDKHAAARLAQRTFGKPNSDLPSG